MASTGDHVYEIEHPPGTLDRFELTLGRWKVPFDEGSVGVHAALLHTNQVLFFTYDSSFPVTVTPTHVHEHHFPVPWGEWSLLDLTSGSHTVIRRRLMRNIFCAGHCLLADGRLLIVGGERSYHGKLRSRFLEDENKQPEYDTGVKLRDAGPTEHENHYLVWIYDPVGQTFTPQESMTTPRWYPTVVMADLSCGLAIGGDFRPNKDDLVSTPAPVPSLSSEFVYANRARSKEIPFGPEFEAFKAENLIDAAEHQDTGFTAQYPFVFSLPNDGRLLVHFPETTFLTSSRIPNFATARRFTDHRIRCTNAYGTAVMLLLRPADTPPYRARILAFGGPRSTDGTFGSCSILDLEKLEDGWRRPLGKPNVMRTDREYCDGVLLPDGTVLAINGCDQDKRYPVYRPQIFDPMTESWGPPVAATTTPRLYHSTALLLPDGTVLTAGTDKALNYAFIGKDIRQLETFWPPYLFKGSRPLNYWTPDTIAHAETFEIAVSDASRIRSVALIRNGSVTHSINTDQRFIALQILQRTPRKPWLVPETPKRPYGLLFADALVLRAPSNAWVAPPGYYMLFVVSNEGVPSEAPFVHVVPRQRPWVLLQRAVLRFAARIVGMLVPKGR